MQKIDKEFDHLGAVIYGPFPDSTDCTATALLNVDKCTPYFTFKPGQKKQEVITEHGPKVILELDKDFRNLTPLNRAVGDIKMELVNPWKGFFQRLTCVSTV